ncbi:four-helix bundle copper-binding protein [Exiguobacterium sp. TDN 0502]|uniref:four-helix bundle copper-binding protein n=1 Tax=Exiguobacterium sp. TDN 0502 TaxID=3420731 RepID=UPI003D777EFC
MKAEQNELIDALQNCIVTCNTCFDACLSEEHVSAMTDCIRLDRDCADICSLLVQAVVRNSSQVTTLAAACIEICENCARECAKHDHEHCQNCAEACLACAKHCQQLV